jgi:hypothetical protein
MQAAKSRGQWPTATPNTTLPPETKVDGITPKIGLIFTFPLSGDIEWVRNIKWGKKMTDQQLVLHAVKKAQRILEEYLEPRPYNNERILDELVEVLERPDLVVAVSRLQQRVIFEDDETN